MSTSRTSRGRWPTTSDSSRSKASTTCQNKASTTRARHLPPARTRHLRSICSLQLIEEQGIYHLLCSLELIGALDDPSTGTTSWLDASVARAMVRLGCSTFEHQAPVDNRNYTTTPLVVVVVVVVVSSSLNTMPRSTTATTSPSTHSIDFCCVSLNTMSTAGGDRRLSDTTPLKPPVLHARLRNGAAQTAAFRPLSLLILSFTVLLFIPSGLGKDVSSPVGSGGSLRISVRLGV